MRNFWDLLSLSRQEREQYFFVHGMWVCGIRALMKILLSVNKKIIPLVLEQFYFQPHFDCLKSYNFIKTDAFIFCTIFRLSSIICEW